MAMKKPKAWMKILTEGLTIKHFAMAVISGILCATSYPPFLGWALFFCFVPLWLTITKTKGLKQAFILSFVTQFVISLVGFYWIAFTAKEFGQIPFPLNILVLIGYCCIANLHFVAATLTAVYLREKLELENWAFFLTLALFYGAFEYFWPAIFPWNLGYSFYFSHFKTAQLAEFVGFNILSLYVYFINFIFALSFSKFRKKGGLITLLNFVFLFCLTESLGQISLDRLPKEDQTAKVMMVQTNMGSYELYYRKFGNAFQMPIMKRLLEQTEAALKNEHPDLVVWAETAFPDYLDAPFLHGRYQSQLLQFIREHSIYFAVGGFSRDTIYHNPMTPEYSAIFLFDPQGNLFSTYRKNILLAFGEHIPGSNLFPFIRKLAPEIGEITPGTPPQSIKIGEFTVAPSICYEDLFGEFMAPSSKDSQILLNITNDSWYGSGPEQIQHLTMAAARTIELRRPMIRTTNTGVSAIIDMRGLILVKSAPDSEWAQTFSVPFLSKPLPTLFSRITRLIPLLFIGLVALVILLDITPYARKRNRLERTP